jgi:hypothetical protein
MSYQIGRKIGPYEILEDRIFIGDREFNRYYHNGAPTRYFGSRDGKIYSEISEVIMKPNTTKKGYKIVGLFIDRKEAHPVTVHKIIATIYHADQYQPGMDVDHIDGNKKNNHADNLEWVTRSENIQRAFKLGLKHGIHGDKHVGTVYPDAEIHKACQYIQDGHTVLETSRIVSIPLSYLYTIVRGESRTDITSQHDLSKRYTVPWNPLSEQTKADIIRLKQEGYTAKEIQEQLGIESTASIYNAVYASRKAAASTTILK